MELRQQIQDLLNEIADQSPTVGCEKFPSKTIDRKLCKLLSQRQYRRLFVPVLIKVLDTKKKKWSEAISKEEQKKIFDTLTILKNLDPDREWQFPGIGGDKILYGTIEEFINTRLSDLAFVYMQDEGGNLLWNPVNKLDTNYKDSVNFIMDIIRMAKTFDVNRLYNQLVNGDKSGLVALLKKIESFPDLIYNKLLSDPTPYTINSLYYSKQGEEIEEFIMNLLVKDGWTLIHRGGDGDPIDVMLGIDLIMEKNGQVQTIQCKKVWNIEKLDKTTMNPVEGAYRITGKPYISKQRNVDLVGYGTLDGKGIVAERQKEVKKIGSEFQYTDKMVLPSPVGKSAYFYIDNNSVITSTKNIEDLKPENLEN
jgi:hypothetical protein